MGLNFANFRNISIAVLCLVLVSCATEVPTPSPDPEVSVLPEAPAAESLLPPVELSPPARQPVLIDHPIVLEVVEDDLPSAWELIQEAGDQPVEKNALLLQAAVALSAAGRESEVEQVLDLIDDGQLSETERTDREILNARMAQVSGNHRAALRVLNRLSRSISLNIEQRIRIQRLTAYSYSHLIEPVDAAVALAELYSLLAAQPQAQLTVGHQLWGELSRMNGLDLQLALSRTNDPVTRQWFVLALALGLNSARLDPYLYRQAIQNWQRENPEHPANRLIEAGLNPGPSASSQIAILLPLSSANGASAKALLDGFVAQHEANTDPLKPNVQIIDIGAEPTEVTQFYYQAVDGGADYVIGPLGVDFVNEMALYADFIVPTLLLGEVDDVQLPNDVFQFALAPEHEGYAIAARARRDGHATALVIKSPQKWSERAVGAFSQKWQDLGGHIIEVFDYELDQNDYSDATKQVLLIDSSASRYQAVRTLLGQPIKFIPRRRQDADFIYLSADSEHGRLLKPYLDFLKAHDLPIYSTSHIYTGRVNKIRDQDLNGIRFADMNWILDQSDQMSDLKSALQGGKARTEQFDRLFAMGIDLYNVVARIEVLGHNPAARFHGVTSELRLAEGGRILRAARWAMFSDGVATFIPGFADPEQATTPVQVPDVLPILDGDRPQ